MASLFLFFLTYINDYKYQIVSKYCHQLNEGGFYEKEAVVSTLGFWYGYVAIL